MLERSIYSDFVFVEAMYNQGFIRKQCESAGPAPGVLSCFAGSARFPSHVCATGDQVSLAIKFPQGKRLLHPLPLLKLHPVNVGWWPGSLNTQLNPQPESPGNLLGCLFSRARYLRFFLWLISVTALDYLLYVMRMSYLMPAPGDSQHCHHPFCPSNSAVPALPEQELCVGCCGKSGSGRWTGKKTWLQAGRPRAQWKHTWWASVSVTRGVRGSAQSARGAFCCVPAGWGGGQL